MQTIDLLQEVQRLPLNERFRLVEKMMQSIQRQEVLQLPLNEQSRVIKEMMKSLQKLERQCKEFSVQKQLELASDELYDDYVNDKELTAFTAIDFDNFYETK